MELSNAMLMAGLRAQVGDDGDIYAAYRAWYDKYQSLKWKDAITDGSAVDRKREPMIDAP